MPVINFHIITLIMKHIFLLLTIILMPVLSSAQNDSLLLSANELYANNEFALAAQQYEAVIADNNGVAPEIYYNLGNAYYKLNEIGRAILNYERALLLLPNYADAQHNLELAKLKIVDEIPQDDVFFLKRWTDDLIKVFSSNQWIYLSVGLFVICLVFVLLFLFGASHGTRKTSFYIAFLLLLISIVSFVFSGIRKNQAENRNEAVIMMGVVVVKSSPDKNGTDLFQLHEGTKIGIKSTLGEWVEVEVGNGNIGWLEVACVERI